MVSRKSRIEKDKNGENGVWEKGSGKSVKKKKFKTGKQTKSVL